MMKPMRWLLAPIVGCVLAAGCGGSKLPPTARVSGKITLSSQPVKGAIVSFMAEGAARAASGVTDGEGRYQLTTFNPNDGAVLGKHKVKISQPVTDGPAMSAEKPNAAYGEAMAQAAKGIVQRGKGVPAKYADEATSGLTAEVTKDGKNEFDFDLQP
jgi:hypothetical protein